MSISAKQTLTTNSSLLKKHSLIHILCGFLVPKGLKQLGPTSFITVTSPITSLTTVYSTVYSGARHRKHQSWRLKSPASRLFTQPFFFFQEPIKENIKAPRHWPWWGESTGHRLIPRTKGQYRGKYFHLMTSSCQSIHALPGFNSLTVMIRIVYCSAIYWSKWWISCDEIGCRVSLKLSLPSACISENKHENWHGMADLINSYKFTSAWDYYSSLGLSEMINFIHTYLNTCQPHRKIDGEGN